MEHRDRVRSHAQPCRCVRDPAHGACQHVALFALGPPALPSPLPPLPQVSSLLDEAGRALGLEAGEVFYDDLVLGRRYPLQTDAQLVAVLFKHASSLRCGALAHSMVATLLQDIQDALEEAFDVDVFRGRGSGSGVVTRVRAATPAPAPAVTAVNKGDTGRSAGGDDDEAAAAAARRNRHRRMWRGMREAWAIATSSFVGRDMREDVVRGLGGVAIQLVVAHAVGVASGAVSAVPTQVRNVS